MYMRNAANRLIIPLNIGGNESEELLQRECIGGRDPCEHLSSEESTLNYHYITLRAGLGGEDVGVVL
jgi:hypothetical protein